jgi:8-oxo-dGTP diphosphatase
MKERQGFPVAVHLLLRRQDGSILMIRRHNTGYEDGKWSVPAGHIDPGESAIDALVREASEELGLDLDRTSVSFSHVSHKRDPVDNAERIDFFFTCETWTGVPVNAEPHKCSEIRWFSSDEIPIDIIAYVRAAISAIQRGLPFSEFGQWPNPSQNQPTRD